MTLIFPRISRWSEVQLPSTIMLDFQYLRKCMLECHYWPQQVEVTRAGMYSSKEILLEQSYVQQQGNPPQAELCIGVPYSPAFAIPYSINEGTRAFMEERQMVHSMISILSLDPVQMPPLYLAVSILFLVLLQLEFACIKFLIYVCMHPLGKVHTSQLSLVNCMWLSS